MIYAGVDMWIPQTMNDVDMLVEKYGDRILFGVSKMLPADLSEEDAEAEAERLAEKYCANFREKPVMLWAFGGPANFSRAFYRATRERLG